MLTFKQRYKPRTTREYTKSDLTVYDSAGNTALNALTVYGKSEVVDGSIKSAGEGYATVRLADLTWGRYETGGFAASLNASSVGIIPLICSKYPYDNRVIFNWTNFNNYDNKTFYRSTGTSVYIKDTDYNSVPDFVASLGDATLCYELADPAQGNTIAIKTDNGSGIDGTMAVFETGTPLRGIPDTDVRDVMMWDGSNGEVTKVCGEMDLSQLTWTAAGNNVFFSANNIGASDNYGITSICAKYTCVDNVPSAAALTGNKTLAFKNRDAGITDPRLYIKDTDYTDATAFANSLSGVHLVYELATPTTQPLTQTENESLAGLRTFAPQTHAQNNAQTEMTVDYTIRVPTI